MCGIYGFIGKAKNPELLSKFVRLMGVVSECRGVDGTGFFAITDDQLITEKSAVKASKFYKQSEYFKDSIVEKRCRVFVGHNRKASVGNVNADNTQPYIGDKWALVHNGTMPDAFDSASNRDIEIDEDESTDTEAFFKCVEKDGFTDELLVEVESYSMVAYNFIEHKMFFARDNHRPMCIIDLREELGVRVFCSTLQIVQDTIRYMNEKGLFNIDPDELNYFHTKSLHKYTVDIESLEFENLGRYEDDPVYEVEDEPEQKTVEVDFGRRGYPAPATALGNGTKRVQYGE